MRNSVASTTLFTSRPFSRQRTAWHRLITSSDDSFFSSSLSVFPFSSLSVLLHSAGTPWSMKYWFAFSSAHRLLITSYTSLSSFTLSRRVSRNSTSGCRNASSSICAMESRWMSCEYSAKMPTIGTITSSSAL